MKGWLTAAWILTVCLTSGPARAAGGVEEAKKGIAETNAKFVDAVKNGDASALASFYTDDAIVLPDDGKMIVASPAKVEELWIDYFKAGIKAATLESVDIERIGDAAIETGRFTLTTEPEGKPPTTSKGKYLVVWKRRPDGSWKLYRDIWNNDPSAEPRLAKRQ